MLMLFLVLAAACLLYWFFHHPKRDPHRNNQKHGRKNSHKHQHEFSHSLYHCVEAHAHKDSCRAAKALHGKRFLSAQAPSLPLKQCKQKHCHCDYIHHEDRRVETRRQDVGLQHDLYGQNGETEKRDERKHGRRKTDH